MAYQVMTDHSRSWRATFTRLAPLVVWIGVIFYFSTTGGSMEQTSRFIRPLLNFLFPAASEETITLYHGYVRKLAHFSEYAILALLAARALIPSALMIARDYWFLWTIALACIVAGTDELNQSFNTARTGSPYDVLLDVFGALCGAVLVFFWLRWRRPRAYKAGKVDSSG